MTVPVEGKRLMRENGIFRKFFGPVEPVFFVRVIFQAELKVFLAAAAQQIDVTGQIRIIGADGCGYPQNIGPQPFVELPIAEMVGAGQVVAQARHRSLSRCNSK